MRGVARTFCAAVFLAGCGTGQSPSAVSPSQVTPVRSTLAQPTPPAAPDPAGTTDTPGTSASTAMPAGSHWVATYLPARFEPTMLQTTPRGWTLYHDVPDAMHDLFDAPLRVVGDLSGQLNVSMFDGPGVVRLERDGRQLHVLPLHDDGRDYGTLVVWQPAEGMVVRVEAVAPDVGEDEAINVAAGLQAVDPAEWARLQRALSVDSRAGIADPTAIPVPVIERDVDGEPYLLTAYLPAGYPLGDDDHRETCYSLTFRGQTSPPTCDTHPIWLRLGGQVFAFGPVTMKPDGTGGAAAVVIAPTTAASWAAVQASTTQASSGPPRAFYAEPLPDDACWIEVRRTDDLPDRSLGPSGPSPGSADHQRCMAAG